MTPRALCLFALLAPASACLDSTPGRQSPGDASGASSSDTTTATTTTTSTTDATSAPDTTTSTTASDATSPHDHDTSSCDPAGTMCGLGNACCAGLYCTGGPYVYGECTPPQPIGVPCSGHAHCQSGHCQEGVCASPGCFVAGTLCDAHGACCSGWCTTFDYGPSTCQARRSFGDGCGEDRECDTGLCVDGRCDGACQAQGDGCLWDNDCCAGTFCDDAFEGGAQRPGACVPLREIGGACAWDGQCASGTCGEAGTCVAIGCIAAEADCYSDLECCTGACSYDGMSYVQGHCFLPQPSGAACQRDAWCASRRCVEGLCAP